MYGSKKNKNLVTTTDHQNLLVPLPSVGVSRQTFTYPQYKPTVTDPLDDSKSVNSYDSHNDTRNVRVYYYVTK